MQRSAPTFNPYNVQCIIISQILLFSVDQHHYIVPCCNVEAHIFTNMPGVNLSNVWTGQTVWITKFYESWHYQVRYFLMHIMWLMISQTLFFFKILIIFHTPHGRFFFLVAPSSCYFGISTYWQSMCVWC